MGNSSAKKRKPETLGGNKNLTRGWVVYTRDPATAAVFVSQLGQWDDHPIFLTHGPACDHMVVTYRGASVSSGPTMMSGAFTGFVARAIGTNLILVKTGLGDVIQIMRRPSKTKGKEDFSVSPIFQITGSGGSSSTSGKIGCI